MNTTRLHEVREACTHFAYIAAPYCHISDSVHYEQALELVESLLEEAADSADDPLNAVIEMLTHAIGVYEGRNSELAAFEKRAMEQPADLGFQVDGVPGAVRQTRFE